MNNLPIINTPQPSGNTAGTSQSDTTGSANNDQASAPFAQVLARKVDRQSSSSASSPKTDSAEAGRTDSVYPVQDQGVVPVDVLSTIMVQIPVETRGTSVMDRAALLASGSHGNHDGAAIDLPSGIVSEPTLSPLAPAERGALNMTVATKNNSAATVTPEETVIATAPAGQNDITTTTASSDAIAATPGQPILEDSQLQNIPNRPELTIQPQANTVSSAATAASIAQSIATAMPNMPTDTRLNTNIQTISTPVASPAWPDDFSQKISWMISQKNQVAELHLNPPNLGPLDIVLKVSDNQATALFASPHANVRDAVENALPKLREVLADNGIMLGNATVSDQSARDRAPQEFAGRQSASSAGADAGKEIGETSSSGGVAPAPTGRRHNGMVDTYA